MSIFFLLLNKCTKEFISLKRIRNNKEVKPKWMNQKIKRIIRETKTARFKNKFIRDKGNFCKAGKGKLGKVRGYVK